MKEHRILRVVLPHHAPYLHIQFHILYFSWLLGFNFNFSIPGRQVLSVIKIYNKVI